jgi:hypothetical protein
LPAHIAARQVRTVAIAEFDSLISDGGQQGPRISIRGKRFRLRHPEWPEEYVYPEGAPFEIVIVGADPQKGKAKIFYAGDYGPDQSTPPDCSSADGVTPDAWIEKPVAAACATCPNNEWGSANVGKGKACRDVKRVFVLPPTDLVGSDVFGLLVPPSSLKHLSNYARELKSHGVRPSLVRTRLSFTDAEFPEIQFAFAGWLNEDEVAAVEARIAKGDVAAAVSNSAATAEKPDDESDGDAPSVATPEPAPAPPWNGAATATKPPAKSKAPSVAKPHKEKQAPAAQAAEPAQAAPAQSDLQSILQRWGGKK